MKFIKFLVALLVLIGVQIAPATSVQGPQQPIRAGVTAQTVAQTVEDREDKIARLERNIQYLASQQHRGNQDDGFGWGNTIGSTMIKQLSRILGFEQAEATNLGKVGAVALLFGGFFLVQMIDTAKPNFADFKTSVLETFFWWRPLAPNKVATRINTQKSAISSIIKLLTESQALKDLGVGDTRIAVENIRDEAAHASVDQSSSKTLEKLLVTRSVNNNFGMIRKMYIAQMQLIIYQLEKFVLKNAPSSDKEFIKKAVNEIKENINTVIAILEQKFDFQGFTDKDTKVELSTLEGLIGQLFNQLISAFGVETKDATERRNYYA